MKEVKQVVNTQNKKTKRKENKNEKIFQNAFNTFSIDCYPCIGNRCGVGKRRNNRLYLGDEKYEKNINIAVIDCHFFHF